MKYESSKLDLEMTEEVHAMAAHALSNGLAVPGWVLEVAARSHEENAGQNEAAQELYRAHGELSKLISPFTPDLVLMFDADSERSGFALSLGPIRLVRIFIGIAIFSLCEIILASLSRYLNNPAEGNIFMSSGWPLLVNEFFYLSTASLGASFSNLFRLNRELTNGTFLPKDQVSYWVQYTLGVVAGLLLSTLLNINTVAPSDIKESSQLYFSAAALALMGGFSSGVVQRLVQRLIETLEAVLRGASDREVESREEAHKQRLDELLAKDRMRATLMLVDVQRRLASGESSDAIRTRLEQASHAMLANDGQLPDMRDKGAEPPMEVRAVVEDEDGNPLANTPYELQHGGKVVARGETNERGEVVHEVSSAKEHEIVVYGR